MDKLDTSSSLHFSTAVNVENFEILKVIGRGAFGKVFLVKCK